MKRYVAIAIVGAACICASAARATCWDQVDELRLAADRASLPATQTAEIQRTLLDAEATRATNDTARCEELVAEVQAKLGVQPENVPDSMSSRDTDAEKRAANTAPTAGTTADAETREVPAKYQDSELMRLSADDLVGHPVQSASGESIADIEAIVRDDASPRQGYAVLAYDDASGVGEARVVVSLDRLELRPDGSVRVAVPDAAALKDFVQYDSNVYEKYDGKIADINR